MKPIIHGTDKQIAYATRLREDHLAQLRKYVDNDRVCCASPVVHDRASRV